MKSNTPQAKGKEVVKKKRQDPVADPAVTQVRLPPRREGGAPLSAASRKNTAARQLDVDQPISDSTTTAVEEPQEEAPTDAVEESQEERPTVQEEAAELTVVEAAEQPEQPAQQQPAQQPQQPIQEEGGQQGAEEKKAKKQMRSYMPTEEQMFPDEELGAPLDNMDVLWGYVGSWANIVYRTIDHEDAIRLLKHQSEAGKMDMWPLERVGERPENPKSLEAWLH